MRFLLFVCLFLAACNNEKQESPVKEKPLSESKHSPEFNQSVENLLSGYDSLTESFVNWDSTRIPSRAAELENKLRNTKAINTKGDTNFISQAIQQLAIVKADGRLEDKRHALNRFTDHLFQYLNSAQYDRKQLFLQKCPMAFNDTGEGVWISGADTIRNPYLGRHHPKYGKGMLSCGENKDIINYTGRETKKEEN